MSGYLLFTRYCVCKDPWTAVLRQKEKSRCMMNIWRYSWSRQKHCCTVTGWGAVLVPHLFWTVPGSQLPHFHKGATPAPVVCKMCPRVWIPHWPSNVRPHCKHSRYRKAGSACMCLWGINPLRELTLTTPPHYPIWEWLSMRWTAVKSHDPFT